MRLRLPFDPIPLKIAAGFLAAILAMLAFWALWDFPTPWNSRGLGPGWECDATTGAATICARDVPPDWQKPRKPK
jgi:hypothetical protein